MKHKIYKIVNTVDDTCYVGCTTLSLASRLAIHKHQYKLYNEGKYRFMTSFGVLSPDDEEYYIELLELFDGDKCDPKEKERYYIKNSENCINLNIPGRGPKEYYKDMVNKFKRYYRDNREDKIKYQNMYNNTIVECPVCGESMKRFKYNSKHKRSCPVDT